MRSDSPPLSWYEPPSFTSWEDAEILDDDDQAEPEPELFTLMNGIFWWSAGTDDSD